MNSLAVMRLISSLGQQGPPPSRGYSHAPEPTSAPVARPSRSERGRPSRRAPSLSSVSSSESDYSDTSSSSDSSYSSYEDHERARRDLKEKPCAYVSPAGLEQRKGKKEFYGYLKEKECPRLETYRKPKAPPAPKAPKVPKEKAPKAPPKPRAPRAKKAEEVAPAPVPAPAPPPASVAPPPSVAPVNPAPAPDAPKARKRKTTVKPTDESKLTPFQLAIRKYQKEGNKFVDAVKLARKEIKGEK